ncbi:MAG TPA: cation diffusion facilitator family transporter [Syntrophorhabdales bacterium]|nr:cation diffusion facilitator family transporter [Syntrophorhabdales bacterium]
MKASYEKRLVWTIVVTLIILAGEVVGGILSNSLALLSDAGHVVTDVFALALSLIALNISRRPSDYRATYGYQRIGILAALMNGCSLIVISIFIFLETYHRLRTPPEVNSNLMLIVAVLGLVGNLVMAWILGHKHTDLNVKSAFLHVLGDTISSGGVIIASLVIMFTGWQLADPITSGVVGVIIIVGGGRVIKEALWVFLELSPLDLHAGEISTILCGMPDVMGVHDVHLWSIGHGIPAFSAHVLISDRRISETDAIRKIIEERLSDLGIKHTVLQMECAECESDALYCQIGPTEESEHHHQH